jgi:SAM-dependent methyltransferase
MATDGARWVEDLRLQALRGLAAGQALCSCAGGYHILWGSLRAAGCKPQVQPEEPVLLPLLSNRITTGTRILVAGAADAGLVSMIGRAVNHAVPEITVLDRCRAPLRVVSEFAREGDLPCDVLLKDLLELDVSDGWDVVLLHYTLLFIPPVDRGDVLRRLARALRPGGTLICVIQTHPADPRSSVRSLSAVVEEFRHSIDRAELGLPIDGAALDEQIRKYVAASLDRKAAVPTIDEVHAHICNAGLLLRDVLYGPLDMAAQFGKGDVQHQRGNAVLVAGRDP